MNMVEKYLIPPFSEEYETCSEREKMEKTELIYKTKQEVYTIVESLEEACRNRMDTILERQVDVRDLLLVFEKKEIQLLSQNVQEYNVLNRLCRIAEMEKVVGEVSVLSNIHCMDDVMDYYQKCIFLIRKFELDWEEDGALLNLIQQKKLSYISLAELIGEKMIIQKVKAGCQITDYLYRNGCQREAILFIVRLEQRLPYSVRKIMHFTTTLLNMGERRMAYEMLMKHQNPNEDVIELQNMLRTML